MNTDTYVNYVYSSETANVHACNYSIVVVMDRIMYLLYIMQL